MELTTTSAHCALRAIASVHDVGSLNGFQGGAGNDDADSLPCASCVYSSFTVTLAESRQCSSFIIAATVPCSCCAVALYWQSATCDTVDV
jgi:hypothetical protein